MSAVHTRTHTYITPANPYLICGVCARPVPRWHDGDACGCEIGSWLEPCKHTAGTVSRCPTWSPVTDCTCTDKTTHR